MLLALRFVLRNSVFHRWAWRRGGRQHERANNARAVIASPTWLAFNNCWRLGACMQVASICEVKARRVFAQRLVQIMRPCSRNTAQCCSIAAALIVAGIIPMGVLLATCLALYGGLNLRSLEFPIAAARLESARRRMPCRTVALGIALRSGSAFCNSRARHGDRKRVFGRRILSQRGRTALHLLRNFVRHGPCTETASGKSLRTGNAF